MGYIVTKNTWEVVYWSGSLSQAKNVKKARELADVERNNYEIYMSV